MPANQNDSSSAIPDYYGRLAQDYDRDRFGNSYGRYLDAQERAVLDAWLSDVAAADVLDIGCGTGRLLDYAMTGLDASVEMLKLAAAKFPDRQLVLASLPELKDAPDRRFAAAICFHVFMHLDPLTIERSLRAIADQVLPGGRLILDIPSRHRRASGRRKPSPTGWHGNTAAGYEEIAAWAGPQWHPVRRRGLLFFPIHRIPSFLRKPLRKLDDLIGRSPLARYSSYHVYQLERRP